MRKKNGSTLHRQTLLSGFSDNGWINSELILNWGRLCEKKKKILPEREPRPRLLLLDGDGAHFYSACRDQCNPAHHQTVRVEKERRGEEIYWENGRSEVENVRILRSVLEGMKRRLLFLLRD